MITTTHTHAHTHTHTRRSYNVNDGLVIITRHQVYIENHTLECLLLLVLTKKAIFTLHYLKS